MGITASWVFLRCAVIALYGITINCYINNNAVVTSFTINPPSETIRHSTTTTRCYGRKRGRLTQNVSSPSSDKENRNKRKSKSKNGKEASISPSLSDWAASRSTDGGTATPPKPKTARTLNDDDNSSASTFAPFTATAASQPPQKPSARRERQAERQLAGAVRRSALSAKASSLRGLLSETNLDIQSLLRLLSEVISEFGPGTDGGTPTKTFFQTKSTFDYRLAWVGSDDAICHVGTGLHKVPLARLQEIFLTVGNIGTKSKSWRMMEVIRILGPFPNVRNTLLGQVTQFRKDADGRTVNTGIRIRYDSIIDGIGKELNAGTEGDKREFNLNILYADEELIIGIVPSESDDSSISGIPGCGQDGNNVLIFLKEDELDERLEEMRVSG